MNVAIALLNPINYHARTPKGEGLVRVASNTVRGERRDLGELRYAIKDRGGRPWPLEQLRLAVLDALFYGDGFLTEDGVHVTYQTVEIEKGVVR